MMSPSGTSFALRLEQLADKEPDAPAITFGGVTLTRNDLAERTSAVARLFAAEGVTQGSIVTIGFPNSVEFIESVLATWHLGATPQPISHRLSRAERAEIIRLADPALVVGFPAADAAGRPTVERLEEIPSYDAKGSEPAVAPVWKVVTSGGSTGRPKLIVAAEPALVETVAGTISLLRLPVNGRVLVTGPMSHNAPFGVAMIGLLAGNHVVVMERFDAAEALRLVEEHRINWMYLVPTMMLRIWRLPEAERLRRDVSSLEVAFHMAAPCPAWLKQAWLEWLGPDVVWELYGGTEAQSVSVISGREWVEHRGSVGRPVIGEMQIRGTDQLPLGANEVGEIWMRRGAGMGTPYRYIGAKAKTADGGWESLGDLGYIDVDGYVYITDRDTDMILVGGANVYPAEVEAAIDEHPAVRSSCVIGLPHEDLGSSPHALVELAAPVTDDELLGHLRERLASYKLPRSIERVDHPLRDDAGKVRRPELRAERVGAKTLSAQ